MVATSLFTKRLAFLLGSVAVLVVIENDILMPSLRLPLLLRNTRSRHLSLNLGGGRCEWTPAEAPESVIDFHKTVIAGYPSGDKRMVFMQMEALTGWAAIDSWDFRTKSNNPFIKTNYPHLAGTWGWGGDADQVVLVLRNMRTSLIEYHDIAWDFEYEIVPEVASAEEKAILGAKLYASEPPIEAFYTWRDAKVMDEIDWYGWFIDYWMEGGLRRDVLTHQITTEAHWDMLRESESQYGREALSYDLVVGPDTVVTPSYDNFCEKTSSLISEGCAPVAVFSGEKLVDYEHGPAETAAIANVLLRDDRTGHYVIPSEAWDCIWNETIVHKKGGTTVYDRPNATYENGGRDYSDRGFSAEMLTKMLLEHTRLIAKYSGIDWNAKVTANRLVELLTEHRALIVTELDEVNRGLRRLADNDFLGPNTRLSRRQKSDQSPGLQENFDKYFDSLEKKVSMFHQHSKKTSSAPAGLRAPSWAHMIYPW